MMQGSAARRYPVARSDVLATLIIGVFLMIIFVIWEWKMARYLMIPRELFAGQRVIAVAYLVAFVGGMNFYSILNFFPLEFTTVFPPDPIQVGLKGLAGALTLIIGASCINASLSYAKGYNREIILASCVIMTAFGGALAAVTPDTPRTFVALGALATFGVAGIIVPASTIAITVAPDNLIATCVALSHTVRVVRASVGYTIYFNIFYNKLTHQLPLDIAAYAIKAGLPITSAKAFVTALLTHPLALAKVPGVTPAVLEAATIGGRWAYAYALKYVWLTSIGFGTASIVVACFLPNIAKYMTNRIAAKISH